MLSFVAAHDQTCSGQQPCYCCQSLPINANQPLISSFRPRRQRRTTHRLLAPKIVCEVSHARFQVHAPLHPLTTILHPTPPLTHCAARAQVVGDRKCETHLSVSRLLDSLPVRMKIFRSSVAMSRRTCPMQQRACDTRRFKGAKRARGGGGGERKRGHQRLRRSGQAWQTETRGGRPRSQTREPERTEHS